MDKDTLSEESKYRDLFLASRDAIMTLEAPTWRFTSGNPAAIKMFGAKDEADFISYEPWKLSPEFQPDGNSSMSKAKEMIDKAMRDGSNFFDWTHRRINGEDFYAEVLLSKVGEGDKAFLHACVRDITKRKIDQEILEKLNKLMIGRELKMIELKEEIKNLKTGNKQ
jgi:PAS domain S-box-containing protein